MEKERNSATPVAQVATQGVQCGDMTGKRRISGLVSYLRLRCAQDAIGFTWNWRVKGLVKDQGRGSCESPSRDKCR